MSQLRFSHLLPYERLALGLNGCGGKGGWVNPPELAFHDACMEHDFAYWVGGAERDRKAADRRFLRRMIDRASSKRRFAFAFHALTALVYYASVRRYGRPYFWYGPKRSWPELHTRVKAWRVENRGRLPICGCKSAQR